MNEFGFKRRQRVRVIFCVAVILSLTGCQTSPKIQNAVNLQNKKNVEQLEKELLELQIRNSILLKALNTRNQKNISATTSNKNQSQNQKQKQEPFPKFDELMFEQAQDAYNKKDLDRLLEAFRIVKTNHPKSEFLPKVYIWLSDLQLNKKQYTQSLVTLDEFIKNYPKHTDLARATYLKARLYEKLNLKVQAIEVYKFIQNNYPKSQERALAEEALKEISK